MKLEWQAGMQEEEKGASLHTVRHICKGTRRTVFFLSIPPFSRLSKPPKSSSMAIRYTNALVMPRAAGVKHCTHLKNTVCVCTVFTLFRSVNS